MLAPEPAVCPPLSQPLPAEPSRALGPGLSPGGGFPREKPVCSAQLGEPEVRGWVLRAGRLGEVVHTCDGGLAEEAVLVVHQVLVDAGFA